MDTIRPAYRFVGGAVGIRASAADAHVDLAAQLGLDVAHQGDEAFARRGNRLLKRIEVLGRFVEPVHVAVEHDEHVAILVRDHVFHRLEGERVSVQTPDDVQDVAGTRGVTRERIGGNMVVDRTDAPRILEQTALLPGYRT